MSLSWCGCLETVVQILKSEAFRFAAVPMLQAWFAPLLEMHHPLILPMSLAAQLAGVVGTQSSIVWVECLARLVASRLGRLPRCRAVR